MKNVLTLVVGIPAILLVTALLMPFVFIGLAFAGACSLIVQLKYNDSVDAAKVLREIEDSIGWKN